MFCEGPQTSGKEGWSAATPPSEPRNRGQLSSADTTAKPNATPQSAPATRALTASRIVRVSCARIDRPSMGPERFEGTKVRRNEGSTARRSSATVRGSSATVRGSSPTVQAQLRIGPSHPRTLAPSHPRTLAPSPRRTVFAVYAFTSSSDRPVVRGAKSATSNITIHSAVATTTNIGPAPQRSRTGSRTNGIAALDRRLKP